MTHQWLFLNSLDSVTAHRRHVSFYVNAHNGQIPPGAFRGQTPDEIYFGTGDHIPGELEAVKRAAQEARLDANRVTSCNDCRLRGAGDRADDMVAA